MDKNEIEDTMGSLLSIVSTACLIMLMLAVTAAIVVTAHWWATKEDEGIIARRVRYDEAHDIWMALSPLELECRVAAREIVDAHQKGHER